METNRDQIERRLRREGWWLVRRGSNHDIYRHDGGEGHITVPRHPTLRIETARSIAKKAGWI